MDRATFWQNEAKLHCQQYLELRGEWREAHKKIKRNLYIAFLGGFATGAMVFFGLLNLWITLG